MQSAIVLQGTFLIMIRTSIALRSKSRDTVCIPNTVLSFIDILDICSKSVETIKYVLFTSAFRFSEQVIILSSCFCHRSIRIVIDPSLSSSAPIPDVRSVLYINTCSQLCNWFGSHLKYCYKLQHRTRILYNILGRNVAMETSALSDDIFLHKSRSLYEVQTFLTTLNRVLRKHRRVVLESSKLLVLRSVLARSRMK